MAIKTGNGDDNIIFGTQQSDVIQGEGGNDILLGGAGDDLLDGGTGADTMQGGDHNDDYFVDNKNDKVVEYENGGIDTVFASITFGLNSAQNVENLVLAGSADINGYGTLGDNWICGNSGNNELWGYGGNDDLMGGGGADILNGGTGIDAAFYIASDEAVFVSLYHDVAAYGEAEGDELNSIENLSGSMYDDHLWGDDGANVLAGNDGEDSLKGFGGADTLSGGQKNDSLCGMDGIDALYGENGNDMLDGGAGNDKMVGGDGDDSYYVDSLADTVTELAGEGNDTVYSTAYNYVLSDPASVEVLSLDTATDTGVYITGNSQHQTIFGNANDNVLDGGGANDILSGLGGNDTFVFYAGEAHGDVVHEFEGNGAAVGDQLQFVGYGPGATFTQQTATEWFIASADGSISEVITFIGGPAIDPTDYVYY